jgi:hypothetical protein
LIVKAGLSESRITPKSVGSSSLDPIKSHIRGSYIGITSTKDTKSLKAFMWRPQEEAKSIISYDVSTFIFKNINSINTWRFPKSWGHPHPPTHETMSIESHGDLILGISHCMKPPCTKII